MQHLADVAGQLTCALEQVTSMLSLTRSDGISEGVIERLDMCGSALLECREDERRILDMPAHYRVGAMKARVENATSPRVSAKAHFLAPIVRTSLMVVVRAALRRASAPDRD